MHKDDYNTQDDTAEQTSCAPVERLVSFPLRIENIRRGKGKQKRYLYGRLVDSKGELLISATLDYIVKRIGEF